MKIRDRVLELRRVKAGELLPNARNWRTHPKAQQDALRGILAEVGFAGALLAYETPEGLRLIDGHLRAETTPDMEVPVLVLDVNDKEAAKILATYDPLGAVAEADAGALEALLEEAGIENEALLGMLGKAEAPAGLGAAPGAPDLKSRFGVIVICPDEAEQERTYNRLLAEGYECRVVVT